MRLPDFDVVREIINDLKKKIIIHNNASDAHQDIRVKVEGIPKVVIVSDETPDRPCATWLKPRGKTSLGGSIGGEGDETPSTYTINLGGVQISDVPPENINKLWLKEKFLEDK